MNNIFKPTDAIKHPADKRVAIPTTELAGEEAAAIASDPKTAEYQTFRHEFTRGRDPELYWLGKYRNDDEETRDSDMRVDIRSLYVHEDIQPEQLIDRLYRTRSEGNLLFGDEVGNVIDDELQRVAEYYRHHSDWKNRLIQGDSLLVMNSLLNREGMAGKVQCIYIDPPYGIKYKSNWQMKLNNMNVSEGKDTDLSGEPEMIKAFRDTWINGVHSYLSYLRDRLVISRELLTQSGSCFVQISDDNVHLIRSLMDETFGSENFVAQIPFRKKLMPLGAKTLEGMCDYIVWYAKDINNIKYRQLYKKTSPKIESRWTNLKMPDGTTRKLSQSDNMEKLPAGSEVYRLVSQRAPSFSELNVYDFEFNGMIFHAPKGGCWVLPKEKMKKIKDANRLEIEGDSLSYILYHSDYPYSKINNFWDDTAPVQGKQYVVQTSEIAIQRCILMSSDPGDLVLDPTCGSGTTAFVAEQWGRRWITIDTSRIAINIAKKRLMMATYPFYTLADSEGKDVRVGFKYKTVPHITLKSIANDEEPEMEVLYDQPQEDKRKLRVSGPFTVETLQSFNVISPEELDDRTDEAEENRLFQERVFSHLETSGVRNGDRSQKAVFHGMEPVASPFLHARGYYTDSDGEERLVYFHIGPKFGSVSKQAVSLAVREMRNKSACEGASWLVLLGFSFEDNINDKDYNFGNFTVSKVRMHDDLMQDGLLKKDKGAGAFITIGEPDIAIVKDSDELCHVEIRGLDIYDPIKDVVKPRSVEDIAYWEMDDNYDGTQFIMCSIHFCGGDKKEFEAWRKGLGNLFNSSAKTKKKAQDTLRVEFSDEIWETLYGFASEPIKYEPGRQIAVRVISQFGEESSKVLTIE